MPQRRAPGRAPEGIRTGLNLQFLGHPALWTASCWPSCSTESSAPARSACASRPPPSTSWARADRPRARGVRVRRRPPVQPQAGGRAGDGDRPPSRCRADDRRARASARRGSAMRRPTPRVAPAMLGALVALAVVGCGSSSLSASQLRARATPICKLAARQLSAIPAPALPERGARFLSQGIAALAPEISHLRALGSAGDYGDALRGPPQPSCVRFARRGGDYEPATIPWWRSRRSSRSSRRSKPAPEGDWRSFGLPACASL